MFAGNETVVSLFGENLNFFHSVFVAAVAAVIANILVSKCTQAEPNKSKLTWVGLGVFSRESLRYFGVKVAGTLAIYAVLGVLMWKSFIPPVAAGAIAALWTWIMFLDNVLKMMLKAASRGRAYSILKEDRFWGGLLAACAVFMLFYFK